MARLEREDSERGGASTAVGRGLRVVEIDPETDPRWLMFLEHHPGATVYHHPAWLTCLQREYRREALNLASVDAAGELHGVLPLVRTRGLPFNVGRHTTVRRLASLPRTPFAGPLGDSPAASSAVVTAAMERIHREPDTKLQLKLPGRVPALEQSVPSLAAIPWRQAYVLDLPADGEPLRLGRTRKERSTIRWSVRKSENLGVRVRQGESEADLRRWYRLYLDVMRQHTVPPRPYRFFSALWEGCRPQGLLRLYLAELGRFDGGVPLAGMLSLYFAGTVSWGFAGARHDVSGSASPLDALHYRAIHDAWREGYRHYDFGEVLDGDAGLAHFKRKWGGRAVRLHRYEFPAPGPVTSRRPESADTAGHRPWERAWRKVPLAVTSQIGDRVYGFL